MGENVGEHLNKGFQQSLWELRTLSSQVKSTMTRTKRGRVANTSKASKAAVETTTSGTDANARATAANPEANVDGTGSSKSCIKDSQPVIFSNMHDYLGAESEVNFDNAPGLERDLYPPLPLSPATFSATPSSSPTSPAPKVARSAGSVSPDAMTTLLAEFSSLRQLLNSRADALEIMINKNSVAIAEVKMEGKENSKQISILKADYDNMKTELVALKERLEKVESQPQAYSHASAAHMRRLSNLEDYSRRWNLILHGLGEKEHQDVRRETIRVLQEVLPVAKEKIPGAVDTIHRLGPKRPGSSRSRPIIIQFAYRIHKDAIWAAVKDGDNAFLLANKMKITLDFSPEIRERRRLLWPQVDQARKDHKRAFYVGGRAFIDGVEIFPP